MQIFNAHSCGFVRQAARTGHYSEIRLKLFGTIRTPSNSKHENISVCSTKEVEFNDGLASNANYDECQATLIRTCSYH